MTIVIRATPAPKRPGVNIAIESGQAPVASEIWSLGGWTIQFVRLDARQRHPLNQTAGKVYVKVITGRIDNVERGAYAQPKVVRGTRVDAAYVEAGEQGALFAIFTATTAVAETVSSIGQLRVGGPHAEALRWQSFEGKYGAIIPFFNGLDAHLLPGFHLLDAKGDEIAYVFLWVAGKGVDLSTHNHGHAPNPENPAFAEVHWVLHNGTGSGGMYEIEAPGAAHRQRYPMQRGDEHGPFFKVDASSGRPEMCANGAVAYPWHGWEAGASDGAGQAYDVVAAFEITAPYADTRA